MSPFRTPGTFSLPAPVRSVFLAQSVGGGGGIRRVSSDLGSLANLALGGSGGAGGNGGDVNVNVTGTIETYGDGAYGVLAQSVGGGGGIAGNVNQGISCRGSFFEFRPIRRRGR